MKQAIFNIEVEIYNCARNADLGLRKLVNVSRGSWGINARIKQYRRISIHSIIRAQRAQLALCNRKF